MSTRHPGEIRDPETGEIDPKEVWYKIRSALAIGLSLAIFIGGGWFIYDRASQAWLDFLTTEDYIGEGVDPVEVTIPSGATITKMAEILVAADVVKTEKAFVQEAAKNPDSSRISYGRYNLKTQLPAELAITMLLDPANQIHNRVVLRDGQRIEQVATSLSKSTGIAKKRFNVAFKNWKKLGLPSWAKHSAEGFIFPDTYEIAAKPTATGILKQTVTQFEKVTSDLGFSGGSSALGYDPYEVLTMASIIEKEAGANDEDRAKIARVFYNRLEQGMKLQSDATVAYANKITGRVFTTATERKIKSRYNTYRYAGLPYGPITSPSRKSMEAALHPVEGDWLYFTVVNLDTGETAFAATLAEHSANTERLQAWCLESQANRDKCNGK